MTCSAILSGLASIGTILAAWRVTVGVKLWISCNGTFLRVTQQYTINLNVLSHPYSKVFFLDMRCHL